jgi:hypothetical protein
MSGAAILALALGLLAAGFLIPIVGLWLLEPNYRHRPSPVPPRGAVQDRRRAVLPAAYRVVAGLALLGLGAAGCAGALPIGQNSTAPLGCVPPGLPPLAGWHSTGAVVGVVVDEVGRSHVGILEWYLVGGRSILAFWVEGRLATVDPDSDDPSRAVWRDPGVVTAAKRLAAAPVQTCAWEEVSPSRAV